MKNSKTLTEIEIAREALRQLAVNRKLPTPDNYRSLYYQIAGVEIIDFFPEKTLKIIIEKLPRNNSDQQQIIQSFEAAVSKGDWESLGAILIDLLSGNVIKQNPISNDHSNDHHLEKDNVQPNETGKLITSILPRELQDQLGRLFGDCLSILLSTSPEISKDAESLAREVRVISESGQLSQFTDKLKQFNYQLQYAAEDQGELRTSLLKLFQLVIDNISELVVDDAWLQGQIAIVREMITEPLDLRLIDNVERQIKELIYKQGLLKKNLIDNQSRLKLMLSSFVDRLAEFTQTTGDYHASLGVYAEEISQAEDISELSDVLDRIIQQTRQVQSSAKRSHDELLELRSRAESAEKEVNRLQSELLHASELIRHDALTGALNRKGLEEAIEREVSRKYRDGSSLCIALLDIDNFKKLNDTHGHEAGDDALVHLAAVVRKSLRPQDTLARFGGEEFVVLLTGTGVNDSVTVMQRVQRDLTRCFFLHQNEKILITFSCGIAELAENEDPKTAIKRADQAMYLAKRSGKNRVLAA